MTPLRRRELARWYELIAHPVQLALLNAVPSGIRFPVVPAGRRSGKTERAKRFLAKQAFTHSNEMYFAGAPTREQAKRIYWEDLKLLTLSSSHTRKPLETDLRIYLPNGSTIQVIGLDEPKRIEGTPWTGGVIDEIADIKPASVQENIMPALNTVDPRRPDFRPWCWFLGVPDGLNHYYDMAQLAESGTNPDYAIYTWKSAEILPPDIIEAAKRTMGRKQYLQEYEASFETASGRIYEDYGKHNLTNERIQSHEQLLWYHDFNYTPLSSGIGVRRGNSVYLMSDIILTSAVAKQSALEFVERYRDHKNKKVLIYGDPAGRAGEKHGHASDYTEIESVLRSHGWSFERKVKMSTRSIKDGQNAVRAKILNAAGETSLFVNPETAKFTHQALSRVQLKKGSRDGTKAGSTFLEDDSDEHQHIATAIRYMVDFDWPVLGSGVGQGGMT